MKKTFYCVILSILLLILFGGCTPKEKGTEYDSIELKVNKNSVNANGEDYILMTGIVKDTEGNTIMNIQDIINFYYIDEEKPETPVKLITNRFLSKKEGKYRVYAEIEKLKSNEISVAARQNPVVTTIELTTDKKELAIDNIDTATLSVKVLNQYNEKMVTETDSNIEYYMNDTKISNNKVTINKTGTYKLKAKYGGVYSNELVLTSKIYIDKIYTSLSTFTYDKETLEYDLGELSYSVPTFTMTVITTDATAILSYKKDEADWVIMKSGEMVKDIPFTIGNNKISVKIQSEDKSVEKIYNLTAYRKNNVYNLKNLELSAGSIEFKPDTTYYETTISSLTPTISIVATGENLNSKIEYRVNNTGSYVKIESGKKSEDLQMLLGENYLYIKVTAEDTIYTKLYTVKITRTTATDSILKSLSVTKGDKELLYGFEPEKLKYDLTVDSNTDSIFIAAVKNSEYATISGDTGTKDLKIGNNTFNVKVKTVTGEEKIYVLNIKRQNNDATLSSLILTSGEITFKADTILYSLNVTPTVEKIGVKTTKNDINAKKIEWKITTPNSASDWTEIRSDVTTEQKEIEIGNNIIEIRVTAEDSSIQKTYTIKINKGLSGDAGLGKLSIKTDKGTELLTNFETLTNNYTVTVDGTVSKVIIVGTTNASISKVSGDIGEKEIVVGDNQIKITVTAQDGTEKNYYVVIHKKSSNTDLSSLMCSAASIDNFLAMVQNYDIGKVGNNVTDITVLPVAADSNATIDFRVNNGIWNTVKSGAVSGAMVLQLGDNTIYVRVTAEDESSSKIYTIKVRRTSNLVRLSNLIISKGSITFNKDALSYDAGVVSNSIANFGMEATTEDAAAGVQYKMNEGEWITTKSSQFNAEIPLQVGDNILYIKVTSEDGSTVGNYQVKIRRKSIDATLSNIGLSAGKIEFAADKLSYNVPMLPYAQSKVEIVPVQSNNAATMKYRVNSGTWAVIADNTKIDMNLLVGNNKLEIEVIAEETSLSKVYILDFRRANNICALTSIVPSVGAINLISGTYEYSLGSVANTVKNITIKSTVQDVNSKMEIRVGNAVFAAMEAGKDVTLNLANGANVIEIKVTAEDSSISQIYTLNLKRLSNNAKIKDMTSSTGNLTFKAGTAEYNLGLVKSGVESITIVPVLEDATAKLQMRINGSHWTLMTNNAISAATLIKGDNLIEIMATSEDESATDKVNLKVRRANNIASLADLTAYGITEFQPEQLIYTLPDLKYSEKTVSVLAIPTDEKATMKYSLNNSGWVNLGLNTYTDIELFAQANVIQIRVYAEDITVYRTYTINVKRKSNNTYLSDIAFSVGDLTFSKETISYDLGNVSSKRTAITMVGQQEDSNATIQYKTGNTVWTTMTKGTPVSINLDDGLNTIQVKVLAEDTSYSKIYTFKVNKTTNNVNLSYMTFSAGSFVFDTNTYQYDVGIVTYATNSIKIAATPEDGSAVVSMKLNNSEYQNLKELSAQIPEGLSTVFVKVTSADGSVSQVYTIKVTRLSGSTEMTSVDLSGTTITFNNSTTTYSEIIDEKITKLTLNAFAKSSKTQLKVRNNLGAWTYMTTGALDIPLEYGYNAIELDVIAEDTSVHKVYTFNITRDISLQTLSCLDGKKELVSYATYQKDYNITIGGAERSVVISATAADVLTVIGSGTYSIKDGQNNIPVTVKSVNGYSKTYNVNINKQNNDTTVSMVQIKTGDKYSMLTGMGREYYIYVPYSTKTATILMAMNGKNAVQNNTEEKKLIVGTNSYVVHVTAEDGTRYEYLVTIYRQEEDRTLASCTMTNIPFSFDKQTQNYTLNVPYSVSNTTISLDATVKSNLVMINDEKALSKNINLVLGNNKIVVNVAAEEGSILTYVFNIKRLNNVADLNSVPLLKDFNKNKLDYIYYAENYNQNFEVILEDNNSKMTTSTKVDENGNYIYLFTVLSEDKSVSKIYSITVKKIKSDISIKELTVIQSGTNIINYDVNKLTFTVEFYDDCICTIYNLKTNKTYNITKGTPTEVGIESGNNNITITITPINGVKKIIEYNFLQKSKYLSEVKTNYSDITIDRDALNRNGVYTEYYGTKIDVSGKTFIRLMPQLSDETMYYAISLKQPSTKFCEIGTKYTTTGIKMGYCNLIETSVSVTEGYTGEAYDFLSTLKSATPDIPLNVGENIVYIYVLDKKDDKAYVGAGAKISYYNLGGTVFAFNNTLNPISYEASNKNIYIYNVYKLIINRKR